MPSFEAKKEEALERGSTIEEPRIYSRICWLDIGHNIAYSRWYRGTAATEQAKAACEVHWPEMKFWIDKARTTSMPEITIQDLIG